MANVPATIDPARPAWMAKYVPDTTKANAEYLVPTGTPFGVITIDKKIWAGKIGKEPPVKLLDEQGFPVPYFDAVVVAANPMTTKTFYLTGYPGTENSTNAPPDCASDDGITPLPNVPHKQHPVCEGCPHNKFRPDGAPGHKGKRCQDNKRLAVLPDADDWQNEAFGGPMLLRLAPSSRTLFGEYAAEQSALGRALHAIVTRMSFDSDQSGIVIKFQFLRYLEETDMPDIMQWRADEYIARVLGTEHAPDWKPPQESEAGEATAAQPDPKPRLNGGATKANGNGLAEAVDVAEKAITKPIEPVKPVEPPKLTADEKKAARIAAVKAEMERELAAKMAAMEADEPAEAEYEEVGDDAAEPIDDTASVMAMLDGFAAQE